MNPTMSPKERMYNTLQGQPTDRPAVTPIFMARAAQFIGHTYRDYYLDGDILAESQLAVTRAFNLDQASVISDPWREASAYGMEFDYPADGVGKPRRLLIQSPEDAGLVKAFNIEDSQRPRQRIESVEKLAQAVGQTHSVLGWVEGPAAEYADLRGVENTFMDLMDKPELFTQVGDTLVGNAIRFALAQIDAGADMIGIGDAVASLISPAMYEQHVLPLEQRLISAIHYAGATAKLHICGNITHHLVHMAKTGADIIDVDWMVPLDGARVSVGPDITLCGNFDPAGVLLQGTPETIAEAARNCLKLGGDRFILMPGCEIPPATPEENIRAFCPCDGCLIREELVL